MMDLLASLTLASPTLATAPTGVGSPGLESYGPIGVFGAVVLFVLGALYKMNEKARESEGKRLTDQLAAIERIANAQAETSKAQATTVNALSLVASRLDELVRDLREVVGEKK